ncbi:MAG: ATP-binding protein [Victivallales bacterium]|nr:ATP-binding protein [Victivallales bacterium]
MSGKSIKFQFVVMIFLFVIFGAAVILQMFYINRLQLQQYCRIHETHGMISSFLKQDQDEGRILLRLRVIIADRNAAAAAARADDLASAIDDWFKAIAAWLDKSRHPELSENVTLGRNSAFAVKYLAEKKRQADAYRRVLDCCREGKFDDAQHILNIEAQFQPAARDTLAVIDRSVEDTLQRNLQRIRLIFLILSIGSLSILALMVVVGIGLYRGMLDGIAQMDMALRRISGGDFSSGVRIASPRELALLANSFNNMQNTIKIRDRKIHEDSEDIKKINEFLEQKVVSINRTVEQLEIAIRQKNEEIDMTLEMMAGELKSRLTMIGTAGEFLKHLHDRVALPEAVIHGLDKVNVGLLHLTSMSEQVAELAGIGRDSMHIQHLPMGAVLKNISDHLHFELGVAGAQLQLADDIFDCQGDGAMLEQALIKLVQNALRYRSPERECMVRIESEADILFVRYKVIDNGIGIAPEYHEKIFQAFFRINPPEGGAADGEGGLGLAIVHRIVTLHNGRVWVESTPGEGSTFIIELPKQQGR